MIYSISFCILFYKLLLSHPTRVRGLKSSCLLSNFIPSVAPHAGAWIEMACPMRRKRRQAPSHPTRVRGLKSRVVLYTRHFRPVAPHAGAWIEINESYERELIGDVAPHAGAWIEMKLLAHIITHPLCVAPHAGAWIEMERLERFLIRHWSHPTRVRGLKFFTGHQGSSSSWSHPTRVRGLKSCVGYGQK